MSWAQVIVLSIVQGLTEFLPISSSGHIRIMSELFWGHDAGASFTAVIQLGTEIAVLVFFARDIFSIAVDWARGLFNKDERNFNYRMGWMVIVGTIPVSVLGFLGKDYIREALRNLWITATVLILFSFVFILAERIGSKKRGYDDLTMRDAIVMGLAQCLALIPGVSRSGGTISAGLFVGLNREVAARFSFLLAIPAVQAQTTEQDADLLYATSMLKSGTAAPDFTLPTLAGKNFSLSQLKGKVVVLDFWASWCPDCRRDAPNVVRLYREYKDKGVVFVGISFDVDRAAWQNAVIKYGMHYTQVSELKKMREAQISKTYSVSWIPSLYVIGRDGKVVLGTVLSEKVKQTLQQLVK